MTTTDDRGFYRFAGLHEAEYFVRLTVPSLHNDSGKSIFGYNMADYGMGSELKTYYPDASEIKEAKAVQVFPGQEQTEINITVPDRKLFKISGVVVAKNSQKPQADMIVTFQKMGDGQIIGYSYDLSKQMQTGKEGNWGFKDLPKGKYIVRVSVNDSYRSDKEKEKEQQPKFAQVSKEIEVTDKDLENIIFELPFEAFISGTVSVEDNKPLPDSVFLVAFDEQTKINASTHLSSYSGGRKESKLNKTHSDFRIGGLSEGKFSIYVPSNHAFYVKSIKLGNTDLTDSPLEIKDGEEISGVKIVLGTDIGTVKGKISNYKSSERVFAVLVPVGKLPINALRSSREGRINQAGEFEVKAGPGEYFVIVGTDNNRPKLEKLDEWFRDVTANAPKVTVRAGETETVILSMP